ncbi:MAG: PAS-domain containing protein [Robiginitomaculum sp.]|nr:PAS-domain containing protein [Robiginitomaculum sp.]
MLGNKLDPIGQYAQTASIIVTLGAVFLAIFVALWALRLTVGARAHNQQWRNRALKLEESLGRANSVFAAHPGLVLVWADDDARPNDPDEPWGQPALFGSPVALGAMLKFAEHTSSDDPAKGILDGLADYEARNASGDDTTLRQVLHELRLNGTAFSLTIIGPTGRFLEADGRAAGTQIVLWLTDSTIKGLEESGARGRLEEVRHIISEDPVAFIDMLGRAPFPVWRLSSGQKLIWANSCYVQTVEANNLDDAMKQQLFLTSDSFEMTKVALEESDAKSGVFPVVIRGERRYLEIGVWPVSGGVTCVARDVSDEQALREKMTRQSRAHDETLDHLADAVAIFSAGQRLIFHNKAFRQLFDLDEQWLDERPEHGALLDHLRERRRIPDRSDYQVWKTSELARYGENPDDETVDELWSLPDERTLRVAILRHPLGGLLYIFEDISDQLTLQTKFNTLISVQRETLNKLTEAVAVFGSDGGLRLHNEAFVALWQLQDVNLALGEPFREIAQHSHALFPDQQYWDEMQATITDMSPEVRGHRQAEIKRADGKILTWVSWPLSDGATVIAWVDITDTKMVEKSLVEKNEAMETVVRLKADFVSHVSYQLRDPLNTIVGYAGMLNENMAGELKEKQRGAVESILTAGNQLTTVFMNILDIAAIDAGTLELQLGDVDLFQVIEEVVQLAQTHAEDTKIKIIIDCPNDIGMIRADAARLKQVMYNLLANAVKFSSANNQITIGGVREGKEVRLWVADQGIGLDPKDQSKVFDEFESGDRGGAGLGLALVRKLIHMHGGRVTFQSEVGTGTVVTCHLRLAAKTSSAAPELALKTQTTS